MIREVGKYRLVIHSVETGNEKTIVTGPITSVFRDATWSPDGKTILCVVNRPPHAISGLMSVDAGSGRQRLVFSSDRYQLTQPVWLPDGRGLLVLFQEQLSSSERQQIAVVSYPDGKFRPITHDTNSYTDLSLSSDGRTLATILRQTRKRALVMPVQPGAHPRQLASSLPVLSFSWSTGGQLLFGLTSGLSGFDAESGNSAPLAAGETTSAETPSVCPNGRYLVFSAIPRNGAGTRNIWRMDAGGGDLLRLTSGSNGRIPGLFAGWAVGILRRRSPARRRPQESRD